MELKVTARRSPLHFELTVEEYLVHAAKFRLSAPDLQVGVGRVVFDGTLTEFRGRGVTASVLVRWHRPLSESTMTALRCRYSASDIGDDGCAVGVDWQGDLEQLAHDVYEFSARHDLVIVEFRVLDKTLDEVFAIFSDVAESTV